MFTIQRAIHTIKGDNSKCFFFFFSELCPIYNLDFLSSIKQPIAKHWLSNILLLFFLAFSDKSFHSYVGSIQDLRTEGCWLDPGALPKFFPLIDDSHYNRIHSYLTAVHCFNNGFVGKQPVVWKDYFAEYWSTLYSIDTHFNTPTTDCF